MCVAAVVVFRVKAFGSSPQSPWAARALGRSEASGLAVQVLAQDARHMGWNPTWSHLFPAKVDVLKKIYFFFIRG